MRLAIDKIIDNIAVIENIETLEKMEVDCGLLPSSSHEGSILVYEDGIYKLDKTEEDRRRKLIEEQFRRLRSND